MNRVRLLHLRLATLLCLFHVSVVAPADPEPAPKALPPVTEARLKELLADPAVGQAHIGLSIVALGKAATPQAFPAQPYEQNQQPVLFEVDGAKRYMSASNAKLYTAALALKILGPDATLSTRVATDSLVPVEGGIVNGNIYLLGGGDPSLTHDDLKTLAAAISARGITAIRGQLVAVAGAGRAESFGGRYPDGWTLDDTLWYYGPEISSLAINRNQMDVFVNGRVALGNKALVETSPRLEGIELRSSVEIKRGEAKVNPPPGQLRFNRVDDERENGQRKATITIEGYVEPGRRLTEGIALPNPPLLAALTFKKELQLRGVRVNGMVVKRDAVNGEIKLSPGLPGGAYVGAWPAQQLFTPDNVLANHNSPPLKTLLQRLLKNSDNLYAEMLLRDAVLHNDRLQQIEGQMPSSGLAPRAHQLLLEWLRSEKIPTDALNFTDGSGLSRYSLITPRATVGLLAAVERLPGSEAFWNSMPIAGVDGTIGKRMVTGAATNNVRAKTGTFSIVSTLSGYVTTRDGHRLAVSLLTNFAPDGTAIRAWQDRVYTILAEAEF